MRVSPKEKKEERQKGVEVVDAGEQGRGGLLTERFVFHRGGGRMSSGRAGGGF